MLYNKKGVEISTPLVFLFINLDDYKRDATSSQFTTFQNAET